MRHVDKQLNSHTQDRLYYHEFKVILWRHFESLVFWNKITEENEHWISNGSYD